MKKIGLTGSIGAGKSAAAQWLRARFIPVHDADAAVHDIYQTNDMIKWLSEMFPSVVSGRTVDRAKLAEIIYADPQSKKWLEEVVHPMVREHRQRWLAEHAGAALVALDIPLLFESGSDADCDEVWVVTAPVDVRRRRVMDRPDMTAEKFAAIDASQMPQDEKVRRASHVIDNGGDLSQLHEQLSCLIGND